MSCAPRIATFRLLDHRVGWDADSLEFLVGQDGAQGIQLAYVGDGGAHPAADDIAPWLPPPALAPGCEPCSWFLVTKAPPDSRLLRRTACEPCFVEVGAAVGLLQSAVAVASAGPQLAVADEGRGALLLFTDAGARQLASTPVTHPGPVAWAPWGQWWVVDRSADRILRIDRSGAVLGHHPAPLPGPVVRLRVDTERRVWIATDAGRLDGRARVQLFVLAPGASAFESADLRALQAAFAPLPLARVSRRGFCLMPTASDGDGQEASQFVRNGTPSHVTGSHASSASPGATAGECGPCFSWYGRPMTPERVGPADTSDDVSASVYAKQGQLLTLAIDSGMPRCRWHRVRLDADVPRGTQLEVAVSSLEDPLTAALGMPDPRWPGFAVGHPHPSDWQVEAVARDFLVRTPPGRYLLLRVRMQGDGLTTPTLHRARLDFPRQTSFDLLPQVFRDTAEVDDFGERFLSIFDALLEDLDRKIERLPALLDTASVPAEVLPWLGSFVDIAMDPAWTTEKRRRLIQAAPLLFRMRGTVDGLRMAIRLVFDVEAAIVERAIERPWGAIGGVQLNGGVRLFGTSAYRFRLDRSALGRAPLRSYGNAALDPFASVAHRVDVSVPIVLEGPTGERFQQLVDAQKPAHTVVRVIGQRETGVLLGPNLGLGIDTTLGAFKPSTLGDRSGSPGLRLGGDTVLSGRRDRRQDISALAAGAGLGTTSAWSKAT